MKKMPDGEERSVAGFSPEITTRMGQQLRVTYGDVMNQGVPDRHYDLVQRLDRPQSGSKGIGDEVCLNRLQRQERSHA